MSLVMIYVEICVRGNFPIYYKATGSNMEKLAVAGGIVIVFHTVILI